MNQSQEEPRDVHSCGPLTISKFEGFLEVANDNVTDRLSYTIVDQQGKPLKGKNFFDGVTPVAKFPNPEEGDYQVKYEINGEEKSDCIITVD